MNRPIFIKSIESTINYIPKENAIGPNGFTGKFYQTFKEWIVLIIYNCFQRIEAKGILPNLSYMGLISKSKENFTRKTLQTNNSHECWYKNLPPKLVIWIKKYIHRIICHNQTGFIWGRQDWFNIQKSINMIHDINRLNKKNHTMIQKKDKMWTRSG